MNITDLILHLPNFLSPAECDILIKSAKSRNAEGILEQCPDANTDINTWSSYNRIVLLPPSLEWSIAHRATETVINKYMDYLDSFEMFHVGIRHTMKYSHMHRLLTYPTGTKIHPHTDHDPYIYGSCTFNLNDDYEGGDFVFFKGKHRIKLGRGDALIFPADFFGSMRLI